VKYALLGACAACNERMAANPRTSRRLNAINQTVLYSYTMNRRRYIDWCMWHQQSQAITYASKTGYQYLGSERLWLSVVWGTWSRGRCMLEFEKNIVVWPILFFHRLLICYHLVHMIALWCGRFCYVRA
jgi:hypothetical protein